MTFFEQILLGHFIGDYILQNKWMAYRKGTNYLPCLTHCLLYTLAVCSFSPFNIWWVLIVFLSHFFIDKFSLADKWLKLINGRSLTDFLAFGHMEISDNLMQANKENYRILRGSFTGIVYTAVDNTMHILLMVLGAYYLRLL